MDQQQHEGQTDQPVAIEDRLSVFGGILKDAGISVGEFAAGAGISIPTARGMVRGNVSRRQHRVSHAVLAWLCRVFRLRGLRIPQLDEITYSVPTSPEEMRDAVNQFLRKKKARAKP